MLRSALTWVVVVVWTPLLLLLLALHNTVPEWLQIACLAGIGTLSLVGVALAVPTMPDRRHRLMLVGGGQMGVTLAKSKDGVVSFVHPMKSGQLEFNGLAGVWLMNPKASI